MPNLKLTLFGLMLPLVVASCASKPSVLCMKPLPPAAWSMQPSGKTKMISLGVYPVVTLQCERQHLRKKSKQGIRSNLSLNTLYCNSFSIIF
ncbi:Rz1 family lipoprotein [Xenorhabdus bovienii]|uniref:Rz1 family lipoprotein n=2 Tax=Xenorhabdus bovienii TaxID=40576 RepID=A0AAJ1N183_XENBV|nr:Rz1 family lipoprotein [Xenorhabdus bovienii]MDE1497235.1 Rz1 family lipoprotein [Xenorhabdus bovienii]MDE9475253.1 Rz1 family lipoprotein [Xenorhabdus bovienii]MDE9512339.1 Rz1 family lipoprotein [Xenorhabdus bovienii]MDE9523978.1 Rz1 family lipoprotein [Xenorhabdus bovienii]